MNDLHEFLSCTDAGACNGSANMSVEDQLDARDEVTATPTLINIDIGLSMEAPWQAPEYHRDMEL